MDMVLLSSADRACAQNVGFAARTDMKRMLALALTCFLTMGSFAHLRAQTQAPGTVRGIVLPGTGVISGLVSSSSGRRLSGITMHLVNPGGVVAGKTV